MSLLLAFAAAVAAPGEAASAPLTLREARSLSQRALARRVLGPSGDLYREVRLPSGNRGHFGSRPVLSYIVFAGAPRSSGNPGLCVADQLTVNFEPLRGSGRGDDPPSRIESLETGHVYRIVGDATDRREHPDAEYRALEGQCARAGPVLDERILYRFFSGQRLGGPEAFLAARALQTVIADARRGTMGHITCTDDSPDAAPTQACADPPAFLAGLSTDGLHSVTLDRCAENATHLCADLDFEPGESRGNETTTLRLIVEIDTVRVDPPPESFRVLAVTIRKETGIED